MCRYLTITLCSASVSKNLPSCCKIRYLMSILRKFPCVTNAQLHRDLHRSSLSPPNPCRFMREPHFKYFHHLDTSATSYVQFVRFCSSSKRNVFKAEAPIGIFEDRSATSFNFSSLRSFNRLCRHINIYFRRMDFVTQTENACLATPDNLGRSRRKRRSQRHQAAGGQKLSEGKDVTQALKFKDKQESLETSPSSQEHFGPQLCHTSSLVTTFGKRYSYIANHINSVFSRNFAKVPQREDLERMPSTRRKRRRRQVQRTEIIKSESGPEQTEVESDYSASYTHFGRHINKYFGVKVPDGVDQDQRNSQQKPKHCLLPQATSKNQDAMLQQKGEKAPVPEYGGLFHSSTNTTGFGENYFQTSRHINQYFKGQSGLDANTDELDTDPGFVTSEKTVSFMNCLRHPTSIIPGFLGAYLKPSPSTLTGERKTSATTHQKLVLSRRPAEEVTQRLIGSLAQASSPEALTACVEALNKHLISYPSCKALMWQEKTTVTLLRKRRAHREQQALQSALRETLALIGYIDPVRGRGIRVLSIDGGGTRGVVPLQVLKLLEAETGKKIHQLFDYICGVSTGAVLAFMLGLVHFSLEECADMYRRFGSEVFQQNPLVGTMKMGWSHSYYNTETWETILQYAQTNTR
ncbi:calcium-independent phospholipase A2-gamma-like isoform X2 [Antennarius striatus]|uniref:calcium-independent phospholipase A2-gamma-like isoform X2 n=1 Tax=Antennarius striatus TaxID=241820 RepID=UPI0035B20023